MTRRTMSGTPATFPAIDRPARCRPRGRRQYHAISPRVPLCAARLVSGEILVKRRSGSETDHGNVAAKRDDQARQEQLRMRRRIARGSCHRASGGRDTRCNSPRIPSACAPGPRRSQRISGEVNEISAGSQIRAVRRSGPFFQDGKDRCRHSVREAVRSDQTGT